MTKDITEIVDGVLNFCKYDTINIRLDTETWKSRKISRIH